MNILLVNHLLDPVAGGGTAERSFQLARFLAKTDTHCTVLTLDIGLTAERKAGLGQARLIAVPCLNKRFFVPWISPTRIHGLVNAADIVHLSGHWTLLNALVYRACRKLGKPYLFCPAGALQPFGRSRRLKRFYDLLISRRILASAAKCVAITEDELADFVTRGIDASRVAVIPNGIDPAQYAMEDTVQAVGSFRIESGLDESPYILFLGRLNAIKGPDLLIEAFAALAERFPDYRLVFAGPDGGMRESLENFAGAHGITQRVHFLGFIGGQKKVAALRGARLLAIPSRREAMSIVVLEAGACTCPVLFTNACGLAGLAQADAGTMVAVSTSAIAVGLAQALSDPINLERSAKCLHKIVSEEYLWSVQAGRYQSLCNTIIQASAP